MKRIFWIALLSLVSVNAFASDITLDLNVIGNDQKPLLNVKTNLPPKTILMAILANPINQGGDGYFGQAKAAVSASQVVQFGPFSKTGDRLAPGTYQVTVSTVMAALQPEEVQPFFGTHGERLTGPQILTLPGTSERMVSQKFQFKINPDGSISTSPHDEHTIGSAVNGVSPHLCAAVSYGNPNYADNMDALAKKAHLPEGYYTRYHEDLVKALCEGDFKEVNSLIDDGDVSAGEAARIKEALMEASEPRTETSAPARSDAGRSYGYSKQKFIGMGLCTACADNAAQWYVQRPTARCGMLAKHALEGDPDAVKELQTFPSYCTWEYK